MGYRAWDLFTDRTYRREVEAFWAEEDSLLAEEAEIERREELRYSTDDVRVPLMPGAGRPA